MQRSKGEVIDSEIQKLNLKIIFGVLTVVLLLAAGGYFYFNYGKEGTPIPERPKKLINASEKIVHLDGLGDFTFGVSRALNEANPQNSLEIFLFAQRKNNLDYFLTLEEFISEAGLGMPQTLRENLGSYNFGRAGDPFLIFELTSIEEATEGAIMWERNMPEGLDVLFPKLGDGAAEDFRDEVIKNQDVRVFASGEAEIFYTFFNKKLLIITSSQKTLESILNQYAIFPPN